MLCEHTALQRKCRPVEVFRRLVYYIFKDWAIQFLKEEFFNCVKNKDERYEQINVMNRFIPVVILSSINRQYSV